MFLEFSDWLIYADVEATRTYCAEESEQRCNCGYCRNFYEAVDGVYPNLRRFLSRFGVDIQSPESLIPITPQLYQASYLVQGKILRFGSEPIWIDDITITLEKDNDSEWFAINLGLMNIPWGLNEDPKHIYESYGLSDMLADILKNSKTPQQL